MRKRKKGVHQKATQKDVHNKGDGVYTKRHAEHEVEFPRNIHKEHGHKREEHHLKLDAENFEEEVDDWADNVCAR